MRKNVLLLLLLPLLLSAGLHKFYVSTTTMEYKPEKKSLQIITKIFIDDLEDVLQARYDKNVSLATAKERPQDETYLKEYINKKLKIWLDDQEVELKYIGRKYEVDLVKVFLEVTPVEAFETLKMENTLLFDLTDEQQNIMHLKIGKKRKSMITNPDNPVGMLNLN